MVICPMQGVKQMICVHLKLLQPNFETSFGSSLAHPQKNDLPFLCKAQVWWYGCFRKWGYLKIYGL